MFIAGTRSPGQWALNAWDSILYGAEDLKGHELDFEFTSETGLPPNWRPSLKNLDPWRSRTTKRLSKIAIDNNVDVIYGHSRGGAILADMPTNEGTIKIGLDSAMIIASNKEMTNFNEGGTGFTGEFDRAIGLTGDANVSKNLGSKIHHVWN